MSESVIVLNASYEELHRVSLKHALKMLWREVAVVEEAEEGRTIGPFPVPRILRLVKYVYVSVFQKKGVPSYSRPGILRRDNHKCAYCWKHATTVDHVTPRSKGGLSSWENVVASCRSCNEKKANRTPDQARMRLLYLPFVPTFAQLSK